MKREGIKDGKMKMSEGYSVQAMMAYAQKERCQDPKTQQEKTGSLYPEGGKGKDEGDVELPNPKMRERRVNLKVTPSVPEECTMGTRHRNKDQSHN